MQVNPELGAGDLSGLRQPSERRKGFYHRDEGSELYICLKFARRVLLLAAHFVQNSCS